jgi:hypothetical protein
MIQETGPTTRSNKNNKNNKNNNKKLGLHQEDRAPPRKSRSRTKSRAPSRNLRSVKKFELREEKRGGCTKKRTPARICTCHRAVFTLRLTFVYKSARLEVPERLEILSRFVGDKTPSSSRSTSTSGLASPTDGVEPYKNGYGIA